MGWCSGGGGFCLSAGNLFAQKRSGSVSCLLCARKDVSAGAAGLRAFASRVCAFILTLNISQPKRPKGPRKSASSQAKKY